MIATSVLSHGKSAIAAETNLPNIAVNAELSAIKADFLELLEQIEPYAPRQQYAYLSVDDDLLLRRAELDFINPDGSSLRRVTFLNSDEGYVPEFSRAPLATPVPVTHNCKLTLVIANDAQDEIRSLPCQISAVAANETLEVKLTSGWLHGVRADIQLWPALSNNPSKQDRQRAGIVNEFTGAVSGLRHALDSAHGPREQISHSEYYSVAAGLPPDLRYELAACSDDAWTALNRLYRYRKSFPQGMPSAFWSAYARCALTAGVRQEAVYSYNRLGQIASESSEWYETRWQIARYDYSNAQFADVLGWVDAELDSVPSAITSQWRDLKSRTLLRLGRASEAAEVLSKGRHLDVAGTSLELFDANALHYAMRMNYAYALLQTGQQDAALAVLNRVGTSPTVNSVSGSMRARANAKLGWYFLEQKYGATAVRIFHRIPLKGLYTDQALLGMGWAMLAPEGEAQPLVSPPGFDTAPTDPPATSMEALLRTGTINCDQFLEATAGTLVNCTPKQKFEVDEFTQDENGQLKRALVYWNTLIDSHRHSAAVLEAHLAAADAYAKLGDLRHSQQLYQDASEIARAEMEKLDAFKQALSKTESIDSTLDDLLQSNTSGVSPRLPTSVFNWLASVQTIGLMQTVSDTRVLEKQITQLLQTPIRQTPRAMRLAALGQRLNTVRKRASLAIQAAATPLVTDLRKDYGAYYLNARLHLTQLSDQNQ